MAAIMASAAKEIMAKMAAKIENNGVISAMATSASSKENGEMA
jgi:hypothetical protein